MRKKTINININLDSDDGDCYVKCMQEVYQWYGYPITTSKIVGMINSTLLENKNDNLGCVVCYEDWSKLSGVMLDEEVVFYETLELGLMKLKEAIEQEKIVLLSVNTFYIDYTDDYLKRSGGFFGCGHVLIVHGFNEEEQMFIVSDPTFKVSHREISYKDLGMAWTYVKDSDGFIPLHARIYNKNQNCDYKPVMMSALKEDIYGYYEAEMDYGVQHTWKDVKGINVLQKCINEEDNDKNEELIENVAFSIYHYVRWSRKSMGNFLASEEFDIFSGIKEKAYFFESAFERWSIISLELYMAVQSKKKRRVLKAKEKMMLLVTEEISNIDDLMLLLKQEQEAVNFSGSFPGDVV